MRPLITWLAAVTVCAAVLVPGAQVHAAGTCAGDSSGGEWPSFGADLANTRSQPLETGIDAASVFGLGPQWTASSSDAGAAGNFQSTPTVAGGCVYAGTSGGWVVAWNADRGDIVWAQNLGDAASLAGGIFAVTVSDGRVHVNASGGDGPFAAALDAATGAQLWRTPVLYDGPGAYTNASAVVFDGVVFAGFSGSEGNPEARGGFALIDEATGEVLKTTFAIPDADFERGYSGGGIWSTAVVDEATKYAYVGAGNPFNAGRDHRHSNAILKIDIDRSRTDTFGEVVDAYKGDSDQYYPVLEIMAHTPLCTSDQIPPTIDNPQCGQIDLDFGASPNLFTDDAGHTLVGVLQKSGVYHVAYADTMQKAWSSVVGLPCAACNAAPSAFDGESIYVVGTPGGQLVSLDKDHGAYNWIAPVADGVHYQAVSVANGVVYTVDTTGRLDAFDAATGAPVTARPMSIDTGDGCTTLSGGVAIARGRIYAACDIGLNEGGWIVAYGTDGGSSL